MNARNILDQLLAGPISLDQLPDTFGLYALWDHTAHVRYIGSTPRATEGFRKRIFSKHVTGSEGRSHKFTQAYCTGRMWRHCPRIHSARVAIKQTPSDAAAAKTLRNTFVRKYCKASYVSIPQSTSTSEYFPYLTSLESQVQSLLPATMRLWEGIRFAPMEEPSELVDEVLMAFPHWVEAVERQKAIYDRYIREADPSF